jgi:hypothetical protein
MDVTHITFFPQQPYLHVVIDTYSKFIWAVPQCNENGRAIIASFYNVLLLWECPLNLKQAMELHIQFINLNNFLRNGTLFMSLASLKIHKDKLLWKGHTEL